MKFKKIIAGIMSGICLISGSVFPVTVNAADYKIGDLNNDSKINAVDASETLSEYARTSTKKESEFTETQKQAADVNKDGKINAVDASNILSYYAYTSTSGTMDFEEYLINPPISKDKVPGKVPFNINDVPQYKDKPYVTVNNNNPFFDVHNYAATSFEYYSPLDNLSRCGICMACVGPDLMPTEARGEIGSVKPSGWQTVRYDDIIEDKYLYNRCHLIAYQLSGENANVCNLVTGTRYLNTEGMFPFENKTANYVLSTHNHVIYRVTPVFVENELVCRGVLMEAYSLEDKGDGICFNVFCYNVQPGIEINYSNGESKAIGTTTTTTTETTTTTKITTKLTTTKVTTTTKATTAKPIVVTTTYIQSGSKYVANTNSHVFHYASCSSVNKMKESNKWYFNGSRDELIRQGYTPCQKCNP